MAIAFLNTYYDFLKLANEAGSFCTGLIGAYRGDRQRKVAQEICDLETEQNAYKKVLTKTTIIVGSSFYIIGKTFEILKVGIGVTFSAIARNIFGAFAVVTMGRAGYEAYRCRQFRKELEEKLKSENGGYKEALLFLKEQVQVSEELKKEIGQYGDTVEQTTQEQTVTKDEAIRKANAKKVNWCARRIGLKATHTALLNIDPIIKKLESPSKEIKSDGQKEAKNLLDLVQRENAKKIALHVAVTVAALVAFVGFLVGAVTTVGLTSYAISGVSALIYLGAESYIVSYDWSNKKYKKFFEDLFKYKLDRDI